MVFKFKQFQLNQDRCAMKIGTDGVLLGAWANTAEATNILDIGTGTGVIALMLAQRNLSAQVLGIEADLEAAGQAQENCAQSPWADRLKIVASTIQDFSKTTEQTFDLIVSNPPFFTGGTLSATQDKSNVRHTLKLPHGELFDAVRRILSKKGRFCVILPLIEGLRFKDLGKSYGFYCTKVTEIIPRDGKPIERLLLQFEREPNPLAQDSLIIQLDEKRHNYTEDYITLTRAFYLFMPE
jgi:tRNA1Val (adenine37-N6)-methyltransferase